MEVYSLSESDRALVSRLIESNNRLAAAMEAETADRLYTPAQAAALLGKNPSTVSRMLADGRLHKVYEGGLSGIRRSELLRYKK